MDSGIENSDAARACRAFLRDTQNSDGGWGFRPGTSSRVEATCWALLALCEPSQQSSNARASGDPASEDQVRVHGALDFLEATRLGDGSWPAAPGEETGCWVTSLCCLALSAIGVHTNNSLIEAGLRWICNDWPSDSTLWRRFLMHVSPARDVAPIDSRYRGWGWTPGTSSWVEPTSFALLALERIESTDLAATVKQRRSLATSLLFDRMCPGGGWNAGNPVVYGTAGEPEVVPTVWSLLALRGVAPRNETVLSRDWLSTAVVTIQSPGSLALAQICFRVCGLAWPRVAGDLDGLLARNGFLENTLVAAWTVLAAGSDFWLGKPSGRTVAA